MKKKWGNKDENSRLFYCSFINKVPSFIIILIVAKFYEKFKNSTVVAGCMSGLKPAVIGFIGSAALSIAATVFVPEVPISIPIFLRNMVSPPFSPSKAFNFSFYNSSSTARQGAPSAPARFSGAAFKR